MKPFLELVQSGEVVLFDGAIGTMLQARGLAPGDPAERWLLDHPEEVVRLHRDYVAAGAQVLTTNSFGGSRFKLSNWLDPSRAREVNRLAAQLAREAAADRAYVAGSVGPTGVFLEPLGPVSRQEMWEAFAEQVQGLAEGGADLIIIETQMDLNEALVAVEAARAVSQLPVIANMTYSPGKAGYRTLMGNTVQECVQALEAAGADLVGTNCGTGIDDMIQVVREMKQVAHRPILAEPNAGLPQLEQGRTVYKETAEEMAAKLASLIQAGAQVVGGCCGTTPEHIRLFRLALDTLARR
ncbi:MAG: homocysteine S-methyltransferase family protein [candidate division KSB1 bacterium]|nr:homocysteine S-methyltransferase family protein [candidate division KSB1 bacterium]